MNEQHSYESIHNAMYRVCALIRDVSGDTLAVVQGSPRSGRSAYIDIVETRRKPFSVENERIEERVLLTVNTDLGGPKGRSLHCIVFAPELIHGEVFDSILHVFSILTIIIRARLEVERIHHEILLQSLRETIN